MVCASSLEAGQMGRMGRMEFSLQRQQHGRIRPMALVTMATATLLISVCNLIQNHPMLHGVHAYSPSIRISQRHHQCEPSSTRQRRGRQPVPMQSSRHWNNGINGVNDRNTHILFGAGSDAAIQRAANETMHHDESLNKNTATHQETKSKMTDLLPSIMPLPTKSRKAMIPFTPNRLSSSAIPSLQTAPAFQSHNLLSTSESKGPTTKPKPKPPSWKERLVDVSNLASLLCVLDCTLLPLVSMAIPALSWGMGFATGSATTAAAAAAATTTTGSNSFILTTALSSFLAHLPAVSHGIAIYFVIPVGLLTTIVNYFFGHKEVRFSSLSLLGVAMIYAANSCSGVGIPVVDVWLRTWGIAAAHGVQDAAHGGAGHIHNACGALVGAATTGMMTHAICPEGLAHRLTNTLGCALLLGSNYYSKRYMKGKSDRGGCAASRLAFAWGGKRAVCPPGCGCESPRYGTNTSGSAIMGGETFFQWESGKVGGSKGRGRRGGGKVLTRFVARFRH
mmetsp:Transcript_24334/g.50964  ORF Transcript_24334/g.50964 Transcript_24334/m.50964 type:complete len:506 (-) Transcript_24334:78-1595(-)